MVAKITKDDFLNMDVFRRVHQEAMRLSNLRGIMISNVFMNDDLTTNPSAAFVNFFERNLDRLAGVMPVVDIGQTKTWLGGADDDVWFSYKDINRWIDTLAKIEREGL